MRIGVNPKKGESNFEETRKHQVIIPVYIPNFDDYFKDSLKILKICLQSLFSTTNNETFITIVNNGSNKKVVDYLDKIYDENLIQEIIHTSNIGKINSVLKGVKGHSFDLITVADADTLFLNGWQKEVFKVFNHFPKAGMVGLVPQFKLYAYLSSNILFDNFLSKKLKFTSVLDPEAMKKFYESIGWKDDYNKDYLKAQLTISGKDNFRAVVGSGHFVATYRKEVFQNSPNYLLSNGLLPKSDREILDLPVLKIGGWRLTTEKNYAYHMGNVYESWMEDVLKENKRLNVETDYSLEFNNKSLSGSQLGFFIKNKIFAKILSNKPFINWFIKFKGLPKNMHNIPWHE